MIPGTITKQDQCLTPIQIEETSEGGIKISAKKVRNQGSNKKRKDAIEENIWNTD
jgi:hypothetical protein